MEGKRKKVIIGTIVSVAVVLFIVFGTLACLGIFRGFNAQRYVTGILDQTFKGEVEIITEMAKDSSEEASYGQYEAGIKSFVKNSILDGTEIDSELEEQYIDLCKKIFADMKYSVQEAEKVSDGEFKVPVKFQPSNVLQLFIASATSELARIAEKKEKGEYRGNFEDIYAQQQTELLTNWYTMLEEAYNNMEFGEEQTIEFKVIKGKDGLYKLEESAITEFMVKILSLDAKED